MAALKRKPLRRKMPPMDQSQRERAADLLQRGWSMRAVAEKVGSSCSRVMTLKYDLGLVVLGQRGRGTKRSPDLVRPYAGTGKTAIEIGRELGVPADWVRNAGKALGIEFPPSFQTRGRLPSGEFPSKIALDELVALAVRHPTAGFRDLEAMTGIAHQTIISRLKRRRPDLYEIVRLRRTQGRPRNGVDMRRPLGGACACVSASEFAALPR